MFNNHVDLDQPAEYEIKIQGRLCGASENQSAADWFVGQWSCVVESGEDGDPVSVLVGIVPDQAALHGLLAHIRDLGLTLLSVDCRSGRKPSAGK